MKNTHNLQVKIKDVPTNVNPTPRPSTSGGRPGTSGGRPGTAAARKSAEFQSEERPEIIDYEAELAAAYGSVVSAHEVEEASGGQHLDDIVRLLLRLDTTEKSISSLGVLVPNLKELTLDHSRIASIRDLGVDMRNLRAISLNDCAIQELDGIGALMNLEMLSLRNNSISDVSPIAMHDQLETLDLHGNRIFDICVGDILSSCPKLETLCLSKNPIDRVPNYRVVVSVLVPQLKVLDGAPIDITTRSKATNAMILDASAAMNQIREEIEDEERLEMCIMDTNDMYSAQRTAQSAVGNVSRDGLGTGGCNSPAVGAVPDTGSELTHGSDVVLAGGVAAAMRKRRANKAAATEGFANRNSYDSADSDDAKPKANAASTSGDAGGPSTTGDYLQEGDLTMCVLGHQPRPGTSGGNRTVTSSSPRRSTSQKMGGLASRGGQKSGSESSILPLSPAASMERKRGSSKKLLADSDEPVNSVSFPDPFARPSSGGRPPRSPLLGASTPRVGSPYQHNETRPSTTMSNGRPMSTYSSYSDDGANLSELALSAPSAPFKVSVPLAMKGDDLVALRSRLGPPSASCSDDEGGGDDHDTIMSGNSHSTRSSSTRHKDPPLRVSTARQTTSSAALLEVNEYDNGIKDRGHKSCVEDNSVSGSSGQVKGIALLQNQSTRKSSIVYRDVVKRRSNRAYCDDDEDEDDEDILVDHDSRHNLMMGRNRGGSTSGASSPKVSARGAKLGADLMAQMSGKSKSNSAAFVLHDDDEDKGSEDIQPSSGFGKESIFSSRPPVAPAGGPTLSSIAGRSLGFDLSGSLAAINQWVEDMDTEGSSDEDNGEVTRKIPDSIGVQSSFQSEDGSSSSNLVSTSVVTGSDVIPNRISAAMLKEERSETSSYGSKSYNSNANREILSRQKILSMCVGKDDRDADDSSLDNDILFIDVNSSKLGSTSGTDVAKSKNKPPGSAYPDKQNSISRSVQKYGGAVGDNNMRSASRHDVAELSEDDDEGDLNDLYAENMLMMAHPSSLVVGPPSRTESPRGSQPKKLSVQKMPLSVLTSRNSDDDLRGSGKTPTGRHDAETRPQKEEINIAAEKQPIPGTNSQSGAAIKLCDTELVDMLNRPPKNTYALRTKSNFQEFFRGMKSERMKMLLEKAYEGEDDVTKRQGKVTRRMDLLRDVLI